MFFLVQNRITLLLVNWRDIGYSDGKGIVITLLVICVLYLQVGRHLFLVINVVYDHVPILVVKLLLIKVVFQHLYVLLCCIAVFVLGIRDNASMMLR